MSIRVKKEKKGVCKMSQERMKILQLLEEGKINSAEAMDLLNTLDEGREDLQSNSNKPNTKRRSLKVLVNSDKTKVNVNVPLGLIRIASQIAGQSAQWIPEEAQEQMKKQGIDLSKIDFEELLQLIDQGLSDGRLVDIETEDEKEGFTKVEIYVD